jgi:membrane-bound ClpP family serine protease
VKNKYQHSILLACLGVILLMVTFVKPMILYRFIGGSFIGLALYMARQAGRDENKFDK